MSPALAAEPVVQSVTPWKMVSAQPFTTEGALLSEAKIT